MMSKVPLTVLDVPNLDNNPGRLVGKTLNCVVAATGLVECSLVKLVRFVRTERKRIPT